MHELSLAQAIVAIVRQHAAGRRVETVELRVGALRQVVPESLRFAFELLSTDTELAGAQLVLTTVPAQGRCRACGVVTTMRRFPLQCTGCGGLDLEVTAGEELTVDALTVADPDTVTMTSGGMRHGG